MRTKNINKCTCIYILTRLLLFIFFCLSVCCNIYSRIYILKTFKNNKILHLSFNKSIKLVFLFHLKEYWVSKLKKHIFNKHHTVLDSIILNCIWIEIERLSEQCADFSEVNAILNRHKYCPSRMHYHHQSENDKKKRK